MLEIGSIIKNTVLEFNTTQMEINMKEDGKIIKDMARAHTGLLTPKINLGDSTQVIGSLIKNKEEAPCSTSLETDMTVCGWITFLMEREE